MVSKRKYKQQRIFHYANTCEIKVQIVSLDVIKRMAVEHFDQTVIRNRRGTCNSVTVNNISRVIVTNYIRHHFTNYDEILNILNKRDMPKSYFHEIIIPELRRRVDFAIRKEYGFSVSGKTEDEWR